MQTYIIILVTVFVSKIDVGKGFASQLTERCDRPMELGVMMMGKPAELDELYALQLFRKDLTEVISGGKIRLRKC